MATTQGEARIGTPRPADLRLPGIVLGVGMGGFADGILLSNLGHRGLLLTIRNAHRTARADELANHME